MAVLPCTDCNVAYIMASHSKIEKCYDNCQRYQEYLASAAKEPQSIHEQLLSRALTLVFREYLRTTAIHEPYNNAHEGHSYLREEFEELWEEVRKKHPNIEAMLTEAVHTANVAIRFIVDVCFQRKEVENG